MDRWLVKKRLPAQDADQDDTCEGGPTVARSTEKRKAPAADLASNKRRKYQTDFLQYGFTCLAKNEVAYPVCSVFRSACSRKLETSEIEETFTNQTPILH